MLNLVIGRAGSGKTTYVRELLFKRAENGEEGLILIVPEQFSFDSERAVVKRLGTGAARRIEVLSFTRLVDAFKREYGSAPGERLDDAGRIILMSRAVSSVRDKLDLYSKQVGNASFIEQMLNLSGELKQNAVLASALLDFSGREHNKLLNRKAYELALIMQAYDALTGQSFCDSKDELTRLAENLAVHKFFLNRTVAIDSFSGFTAQENAVIERIMEQSRDLFITLCADDLKADDGIGLFSNVKHTGNRLKQTAKKLNVPVAVPIVLDSGKRFKNDALAHLERNAYSAVPEIYTEACSDSVTVCACGDISQECDFIAASIRRLMRESSVRARDIAVIFRNGDDYTDELHESLKKYDLPFFDDLRQPVVSQPLFALVRSAFRVINDGFDTNDVLRLLKTGLMPLTPQEIFKLENYVYMWSINGKQWLEEFTQNPFGLTAFDEEKCKKELSILEECRKKIIFPLVSLRKKSTDADCKAVASAVYDFLADISAAKALKRLAVDLEKEGDRVLAFEQERIWELLMETLNQLAVTGGNETVTSKSFAGLFELVAAGLDLGNIPTSLDEITIGAADRIRIFNPRVVFIAGANEGVFPANPSKQVLFTQDEVNELEKDGIKVGDSLEFKAKEERLLAYSCLSSACERLFVTYPRKDASGGGATHSSIVSQVTKILPGCEVLDTADMSPLYFAQNKRSAFDVYSSLDEFSPYKASFEKFFEQSGGYADVLASIKRVRENEVKEISDKEIAKELFGADMNLSASRVQSFYECPFKYFCQYGIAAKKREKAQMNILLSGSISHYVLENAIKRIGSGNLSKLSREERKKIITSLLDEYLENELGGKEGKDKQFLYSYYNLFRAMDNALQSIAGEFDQSGFEAADFELSIGNDGDIPAYEVELADGNKVSIIGSVDRVDIAKGSDETFVRVVDYKSGGKKFRLSDVLDGINMQMLIYLFAIEQNGKERYGEIKPAAVLYKPIIKFFVTGERKDGFEKLGAEFKMNGMRLDDSRVKEIMGNVDIKDLITLSQMGVLKKKIDSLIAQMGNSLHSGYIDANPAVYLSDGKSPCEYCDYSSVCAREDGERQRDLVTRRHAEVCNVDLSGEGE